MSTQGISPCVPSSFSSWKYDVFLSFRGEDTRKNFTDHLYVALNQKGIHVFRDDKELVRGKYISPGLLDAIEDSKFSIIVLSRNYAYSTWCLEELVKIVECKKTGDQQMIFPIFYDVEPTMVRKQTGIFHEAFAKHENALRETNIQKVQKWRDALKDVANISRWELKDRNESEFIKDIVEDISSKLSNLKNIEKSKELFGINSRIEKLKLLINTKSDDVSMIGICGMGGIGKTTIARKFYDSISHEFDRCSFLADVRETSEKVGLVPLQKQLLSQLLMQKDISIWNVYDGINMISSRLQRKKVLVIIDDVVDVYQLHSLVGNPNWFGSGSKIIITSRDKHLLRSHGVNKVYKPKELNYYEALQLFCVKAFKAHEPLKGYMQFSTSVVRYAGGLPLALNVLGSFLFGRTRDVWKSAMERLKKDSENEILDILEINFDGLKETEKKIFLDIACFFKGEDRDYVTKILDSCSFEPVVGICVLIDKSLLAISPSNELWMHDLVQEMGQRIVKRQSFESPGKCSRLWKEADIHHVLTRNTGTEAIEGIMLDHSLEEVVLRASGKVFLKMTNLRLLKIPNAQNFKDFEYFSNELRLLKWDGFPLKSFPPNFHIDKVVEFDLCCSHIKQLWSGIKTLNHLRFMRLSQSKNLIKIPDLAGAANLEHLILRGCTRLYEIHPSVLVHKKLVVLDVRDCVSLTALPSKISMESLRILVLSSCLKLKRFPEIVPSIKSLSELFLDGTAIEELPLSLKLLTGFVSLNLKDCVRLVRLPSTIINELKCLKILNLSGCLKLKNFPEITAIMEYLTELILDGTAITGLPSSIELLTGLVLLSLNNCNNLVSLPSTMNNLRSLKTLNLSGCTKLENLPENLREVECLEELDVSGTAITRPASSIFLLKNLKALSFRGCKGPTTSKSGYFWFPISLMRRSLDPMTTLMFSSLSGLSSLTRLDLSDCNLGEGDIPNDICNLLSLRELNLSKNNFVSLPGAINNLSKLRELRLVDCKRLQSLPKLPSNILRVMLRGCPSLGTLSLSYALESCNSEQWFTNFINCMGLLGDKSLLFSMLKRFFEVESRPESSFRTFVPGSKIPEWILYQEEGSSITIRKPPDSYNKLKLEGYAICCVFHIPKHRPIGRSFDFVQRKGYGGVRVESTLEPNQAVTDHIWMCYCSSETPWLQSDNNDIELLFLPYENPGIVVKRCGIHPVYVHEVEESNGTTNQLSRSVVWNLNEFHGHDFVGSTMNLARTSKRSFAEYVAVESSGSGSDDDEETQPKRSRVLE